MDKRELIEKLLALAESDDPECAHGDADDLLIAYINDKAIEQAFDLVPKWYS